MVHRWMAVGVAGLCLVSLGSQQASAMGPIGLSSGLQLPRIDVSFWSEPFPYGYTPWGRCIRYERFDTEWGPRFRRVSICGPYYGRHYKALRVRG